MRQLAEAFHPSEYIREEMFARDWGVLDLARHMGYEPMSVCQLLDGDAVDELTARALGRAFGTSWEVWLGLQMVWDGSLLHAMGEAGAL